MIQKQHSMRYKTHIAMSKERIITVATVATGEKNDDLLGMELQGAWPYLQ